MTCTHTVRFRGRIRSCGRPAVKAYLVDGEPIGKCARHDTLEVRRYAERYAIPVVIVV